MRVPNANIRITEITLHQVIVLFANRMAEDSSMDAKSMILDEMAIPIRIVRINPKI